MSITLISRLLRLFVNVFTHPSVVLCSWETVDSSDVFCFAAALGFLFGAVDGGKVCRDTAGVDEGITGRSLVMEFGPDDPALTVTVGDVITDDSSARQLIGEDSEDGVVAEVDSGDGTTGGNILWSIL